MDQIWGLIVRNAVCDCDIRRVERKGRPKVHLWDDFFARQPTNEKTGRIGRTQGHQLHWIVFKPA